MKKLNDDEIEAARTKYVQRVLPPLFKQIRGNIANSVQEIVICEVKLAEHHFERDWIPSAIGHLERFHSMATCANRPYLHSVGLRTKEIIDEYNYFERRQREERWREREAKLKEIATWAPIVAASLSLITAAISILLGRITENASVVIGAGTGVGVGAGLMAISRWGLLGLFWKKTPHQ